MTYMLKPCPWCRDNDALEIEREKCSCGTHNWVAVVCHRCGVRGPKVYELYEPAPAVKNDNNDMAVKWWNKRHVEGWMT